MTRKRIYLDLHGVLVDFVGECLELFGVPRSYRLRVREHDGIHVVAGVPESVFWERVDASAYRIYSRTPWLPHGRELLDYCLELAPTTILTAAVMHGPALRHWRDAHAPGMLLSLSQDKHMFAHKDALLIDDKPENVGMFREWGGVSILYPQPWNGSTDTFGDVRSQIREFMG